jgi:uncharacterized protein
MTQRWQRLTYLHWAYDPAVIAPYLPPGVRVDTFDGAAWVGLVPFLMTDVRPAGVPAPGRQGEFLETNVRTYTVGPDGRRGVYFFSLDAERALPVATARLTYRLPYMWSRMRLAVDGDVVRYSCRRRAPGPRGATSRVAVRIGRPVTATPLDDFLSARWGLHSSWAGRAVFAPVEHEPWPLHAAELTELDDELVPAAGLPAPEGDPLVLYSPGVSVRVGVPGRADQNRRGFSGSMPRSAS